jgi:hypothetical protein
MVAGKGGAWSAGVVFEAVGGGVSLPLAEDGAWDAAQRVQRFRVTASPMARRLAGLLAAAPVISLPVVRIIQERLLAESRQVHVAEVFLGGLLKPLVEITAQTNVDTVQYEFLDGVRDALLESVRTSETVNVLNEVSQFVAERLGLSIDQFMAVLRNPQQSENQELVGTARPFAIVTAQILQKVGAEYTSFAEIPENTNQNVTQDPSIITQSKETSSRIGLWESGRTKIYAFHTDSPWMLPFDALVIPVGYSGQFGSFGQAFEKFLAEFLEDQARSLFFHAQYDAMKKQKGNIVKPHQPLLIALPPELSYQLSFSDTFAGNKFIIGATVELTDKVDADKATIAVKAIIRLAIEKKIKRITLSLLGTGVSQLPTEQVVSGMLQAIDSTLKYVSNSGIEEITIVEKDANKIDIINRIASQIRENTFSEINLKTKKKSSSYDFVGDFEDTRNSSTEVINERIRVFTSVFGGGNKRANITAGMSIRLIGDRGSGKTTYLAALAYLSTFFPDNIVAANIYFEQLFSQSRSIFQKGVSMAPTTLKSDAQDITEYIFRITLKSQFSAKSPRSVLPGAYTNLNVWCKDYAGEFFADLLYQSSNFTLTSYLDDCSEAGGIMILLDGSAFHRDVEYAISVEKLLTHLAAYNCSSGLQRIALVLTKCDLPELWILRQRPEIILNKRFIKVCTQLQDWKSMGSGNVEFFTSSAFGTINSQNFRTVEPNTEIIGGDSYGTAVLKNPKFWQPFGLVAPIYWLCTGERYRKLEGI